MKKKLIEPTPSTLKSAFTTELTPAEIVRELDFYIIGQQEAKKAVAIALRNRTRRKLVSEEMQNEIYPKNILMIGNTGIGKTEIARRLAKLADAPFIKVEATKFTEVGYVGRDVESIIRDLLTFAINHTRKKMMAQVQEEATRLVEEKILDALLPPPRSVHSTSTSVSSPMPFEINPMSHQARHNGSESDQGGKGDDTDNNGSFLRTREKIRDKLKDGLLEEKEIEIEIKRQGPDFKDIGMFGVGGQEDMQQVGGMIKNIFDMMPMGKSAGKKKVSVKQARQILLQQIIDSLIDQEKVNLEAIKHTENMGIVFIDEIDKVVTKGETRGIDVSREGVQRDILPLVEGCVVNTRFGPVKTDHILFIAAGAFHISSPSDIIPELQGRFPIRVELKSLGQEEMEQILKEPRNSLLKQYQALLKTEGVILEFTAKAIKEIARISCEVNQKTHNIGARRLSTVLEKLLEEHLFEAKSGTKIKIDDHYVVERLKNIVEDEDLSRYIL